MPNKDYFMIHSNTKNENKIIRFRDSLSLEFDVVDQLPGNIESSPYGTNTPNGLCLGKQTDRDDNKLLIYRTDQNRFDHRGEIIDHGYIKAVPDRHRMLWLGSHQGLYKINPYLTWFDSDDPEMVSGLHSIVEDGDGNIWFAGYRSGLSYYDGADLHFIQSSSNPKYSNLLPGGLSIDGQVYFLTGGKDLLLKVHNNRLKAINGRLKPSMINSLSGYIMKQLSNGQIAIGLQKYGIGLVDDFYSTPVSIASFGKEKGLLLDNVLTIAEDEKGRLWAGRSSQGVALYVLEQDTFYNWMIDAEDPKSFGTISSHIDERGNLWMGSNKGLYFLKDPHLFDPGSNLFNHAQEVTLPGNDRTYVAAIAEAHGYIIAGTVNGVYFIPADAFYDEDESPLIYSLKYGEDIHGNGTEQNCMMVDSKGYLWIGSQSGATRMDLKNYPFDNSPVNIRVKDVVTGQNSIFYQGGTIRIPKDNRNFSLSIQPETNFSLQNNIYYNYHLVNESQDTLITEYNIHNPVISMSYIPPGDYTFHIDAFKNGRKADELNVEICAPRTLAEHPFFWAGTIGSILIGLASFFIIRGRQKRKLLEKDLALSKLKNDKTNLQVQAIISSFNPHFINNSLHWAQSRYKKDQSLVTLIGRLSKNIQYIFTNTRAGKAFHTLAEELELVKNYTTIQKIRFDDGFQLILPDENTLHRYGNIPILLMQLQIHVENAIEHGLRNRMQSSFVKIEIEDDAENFIIHVIDDGAGRKKARELNSRGTQKGTSMLEELHHIFNQKNPASIKTHYADIIYIDAGTNEGYGTRVSIILPKNYRYEIEET